MFQCDEEVRTLQEIFGRVLLLAEERIPMIWVPCIEEVQAQNNSSVKPQVCGVDETSWTRPSALMLAFKDPECAEFTSALLLLMVLGQFINVVFTITCIVCDDIRMKFLLSHQLNKLITS